MYRQRPLLFIALAAVPYLSLFLVIGGIALSLGSLLTPLGPYIDTLSDSLTVTTGTSATAETETTPTETAP